MKVLFVSPFYPTPENPAWGSFTRTEAESLRREGVEVELLIFTGRNRKWNYLKGMFQLRRRLRDESIDLVHAHYGLAGLVARTQWKVPVVVTYEGDDLLGTIDSRGKKTIASAIIAAAGRILARHIDAAIVQNPEMASKLVKANVVVLPHEVNLETFKPTDRAQARAALGLAQDKKYLLFAANPKIAVKRFPLAKAVFENLASEDDSIELLVVYKEPQHRLALYMSACDVLIFPSYQEGSPCIVKQAMACNLPIVATDVGDVRQVIAKTAGCHICKPSVTEFARRIREVLQYRERTDGREHIRHLESSVIARRIIDLYEHVLRRRALQASERSRAAFFFVRK
jgi:teichuronic acid biosynthesis glycosyltransferase TuaC